MFEFSYVVVLGVFVVLIVPFLFGLFFCLNVVWVFWGVYSINISRTSNIAFLMD